MAGTAVDRQGVRKVDAAHDDCASRDDRAGPPANGLGQLVRDRRRAAGWSQRQLAELAGVSVGALRDLEQARTAHPHRRTLRRLHAVLGLGPGQQGSQPVPGAGTDAGALRMRVLGPLAAWRGGVPVELGTARDRAVLGLLALHANSALPREMIIETLWEGDPPKAAAKMVQASVGRLRRQLDPGRPPRDPGGFLVSAGTRYRLQADARQLDLIAFGELADQAEAMRHAGDMYSASAAYAEVLALWQREPLADVDLLSGHSAVTALALRHAAMVIGFAEAAMAVGLHDQALPQLHALAERDPLNEPAHACLMITLAGLGQQAAALAVYDRLRHRLDEQLGVRPSTAVAEAHERVLRQEVPAVHPAAARLTGGMAAVPPRQLPLDPGVFVGRAQETAQIRALAERAAEANQVCVIAGAAGIGKTALAIHTGSRLADLFPDGQLYADLRGFGPGQPPMPPSEVLTGFLRALPIGRQALPVTLDEQAACYRSVLAGKRMLIVLDNAADSEQVRPLLPGGGGSLVLVTARSRLPGLTARDGAVRITLEPLTQAEALSLLRKILGTERVSAEPGAAADISARCGHLPLALRIAADRAASRPLLDLAGLASQLAVARDRLDLLDIGEEDATAMRAVFSWSYQALPPGPARMFRLFGLHTGPDISVPAAAALAATSAAEAGRLIGLLAEVHLVDETRAGRYRMHDLLRVYAAEQLNASEEPAAHASALRRMLLWYLYTVDAADRALVPGRRHAPVGSAPPGCEPLTFPSYDRARAWCEAEYANLITAVPLAAETGHEDVAWQFPVAMRGLFELRGAGTDWFTCAEAGVAAARRAGDRDGQAWALDCLGHAHSNLGRLEAALGCYLEARGIRREIGDHWGERANSMNNLGCTYLELRQLDLALQCFQQVLAASREAGSKYTESLALANLGQTYIELGRADDARACSLHALHVAREIGYRHLEGTTLSDLATTYQMTRSPGKARACYRQALAVYHQAGDRRGEAETLRDLGDLSKETGHATAARNSWHRALVIFEELGDTQAVGAIGDRLKAVRRAVPSPAPSRSPSGVP